MSNEEIRDIADLITANVMCCTKEILTSEEAARYMGISKSHLYKLTMRQEIPHYKPTGKMVYFRRDELEQWLQQHRINTVEEAQHKAESHCRKGGVL
ncbi:MAG: helix-turn-helix domain-containing protein [Bacteroidales bacterium]|nr:helix-turn-helix domain-containing protein [Bacteroidales bacterium]